MLVRERLEAAEHVRKGFRTYGLARRTGGWIFVSFCWSVSDLRRRDTCGRGSAPTGWLADDADWGG